MNFFDSKCQESPRDEELFGICDDQNGEKAYTNIDDSSKWVATVINKKKVELVFTAIDACVITGSEHKDRGRCDGMLTSDEHIFFVELKDQKANWREKAINQLESTVQFFLEKNSLMQYRHKKAFACNKQHAHFQEIDQEEQMRWFRTYGVRLDLQAEVIVV
nr:hypothetical protein [uncultured Chitinophaga sp.]